MNSANSEVKIFAGSEGGHFAQKMCETLGIQMGKSRVKIFSDGNIFVQVEEPVRDKDVYIVQPISGDPNRAFTELLFWLDAFKRASANDVTAIIPYFSYAKGDKKDAPRVSIRARVCAECIELAGADRVVVMDLHAPQVQGFFKIPVDHPSAYPLLCEAVKAMESEWKIMDDLVIVSPDAGFAKRAREYAGYLDKPIAIGEKIRRDHTENAKVLEVIGDVRGKNALIVDDFTVSGGTLMSMAEQLKKRGAKRVFCAVTHGLLPEEAIAKLEKSEIEGMITTDTVYNPALAHCKKVKVVSAAPFFANIVKCIHERSSLSEIFDSISDMMKGNVQFL